MKSEDSVDFRYQFSENVRANRQLLGVGTLIFICNLYFDLIMLLIWCNANQFPVEYNQSFDLVLAVTLIAVPVLAIWLHPRMLITFRTHCLHLRLSIAPCADGDIDGAGIGEGEEGGEQPLPSISPVAANGWVDGGARGGEKGAGERRFSTKVMMGQPPRSLMTGKKLIVQREQEQSLYFDQLERAWSLSKAHGDRRKKTSY